MDAKQSHFKVLMFPFLAHGHIFPFLELSKKLSSRGFKIYFCSTSINLDSIKETLKKDSSYKDNHASIELVELHLPSLPELPPQYHTTKNIPPHLRPLLTKAFQDSRLSFSTLMANLKPDLLVYDMFQPWSAKIAASQGIPAVHFFTGGSAAGSFMHHWFSHKSFETFPFEEIKMREFEKKGLVASSEIVKVKDVDEGFAFGIFKLSCDVVLVKSCRGIEGKYMDYLSRLCERKIVPTGSLVMHEHDDNQENVDSEIMRFLSERERNSTLYISFGSENFFSEKQMEEIAKGLEMIDVNFIWVARSPLGSEVSIQDLLPEGFLERTRERGMVVERWAPQAAILAHESVGGFMSHCGWSSITESLYYGVPVVALPLKIDQPVNARLVVEEGAGVEVERDMNGDFDGEAVAKAVHEVMVERGEGLRIRARELGEKMKMEEDESIDEVVEELSRICMKK